MSVIRDSCPFGHSFIQKTDTHLPLKATVLFPLGLFFLFQLFTPHLAKQETLGCTQQSPSACLPSGLKVSECPLTPFVGLCAGSPEATLSPTGWLCHKGASGRKWGKAIGGAGWRGQSGEQEASLAAEVKGRWLFGGSGLASWIYPWLSSWGHGEGSSENHEQMELHLLHLYL